MILKIWTIISETISDKDKSGEENDGQYYWSIQSQIYTFVPEERRAEKTSIGKPRNKPL